MKKLLLSLILWPSLVFAQEPIKVITPNQSTVVWAAVTTSLNGEPIPAGETVSYEIFLGPYPIPYGQDRNDGSLYVSLVQTTSTNYMITFPTEGVYLSIPCPCI